MNNSDYRLSFLSGLTLSDHEAGVRSRRDFLRSSSLAALGAMASSALAPSPAASGAAAPQPKTGRIWIDVEDVIGEINKNLYGHFLEHVGRCVYDGTWVGENSGTPNDRGIRRDAIEALRRLRAPVVRWPGGCFADTYHWRDGIGPSAKRPKRWNLWWEKYESNAFGTDEFIRYCRLVGADPYLSINVGTGSVQEALDWLEYCNSDKDTENTRLRAANGHPEPHGVRYWGVGNENWGCGGLYDPKDYAREYLRYALYLKRWFWPSKGLSSVPIELVAVGHTGPDWNQIFLEQMRNWLPLLDHLSIHRYFRLQANQSLSKPPGGFPEWSAVQFTDDQYYLLVSRVNQLEQDIQEALNLIDYYVAGRKKIGLIVDEWGTWHPEATFETGFYQQNSMRDAIIAASVFNLLNSRCRDIVMANIAQAFNILHAVALTQDSQMILTPTFHVHEMYLPHQGAKLVRSRIETPSYEVREEGRSRRRDAVNVSASLKSNRLLLTAVNEDLAQDLEFEITLRGARPGSANGRRLWSQSVRDHNTFANPEQVKPAPFKPTLQGGEFRIQLPAHSISAIEIDLA
jgi:alpha-N-arabinofuranosidase